MKKCIKNYSKKISKKDYQELKRYLYYYNKCKNLFYNKYYNNITVLYLPYK
jgi:hypothetical protein